MNLDTSNYIFCASTARTNNIKKLFEVLKEKMLEVIIYINQDKMAAFHKNDSKTNEALSLCLEAKNFDQYILNEDFVLYFEPVPFFKIIKTINNDDTLSLYVLKKEPNYLYIKAMSNVVEDQYEIVKFKLLEFDGEPPEMGKIGAITPVQSIEFPSKKLNNICKDFNNMDAIYIDITMYSENGSETDSETEDSKAFIKFGCFSTFLDKKEIYIGEFTENGSLPKNCDTNKITKGTFKLGSIKSFVKGINANNTQQTDLVLHMDYNILIISYDISTLGKIQLVLESIHPDEIFNKEEAFKYIPDWKYILKRMPLEKEYINKVLEAAKKDPKNKYKIKDVGSFIELVKYYRSDIVMK